MNPAAPETIERDGWRLMVTGTGFAPALREAAVARALAAASGGLGPPKRRSRHAGTWQLRIGDGMELEIFIKVLDAPSALSALKRAARGSRTDHVAHITQRLNDAGFLAPTLIARGHETASRREIMVTPRAEGDGPLRTLLALKGAPVEHKRAMLQALGAEIARLHRCGFVHGDLTPFNIFFVRAQPPRFVLIDHERTRRAGIFRPRRQMLRNLVQLGRFDLPGITTTDRMRVVAGYAGTLKRSERRTLTRRINAMLERRIHRDGIARTEDLTIGRDLKV